MKENEHRKHTLERQNSHQSAKQAKQQSACHTPGKTIAFNDLLQAKDSLHDLLQAKDSLRDLLQAKQ